MSSNKCPTAAVLAELAQYAPVTAVTSNNDGPDVAEWGATPTAELDLDGLRVAMLHDSGPATDRLARMRRAFPRADLVVFGHSHIPLDQCRLACGSSTPGRRPTAGASRTARSACCASSGALAEATVVPVT